MAKKIIVPHFSLKHTMECGQYFRYTKSLDTYVVQSSKHIFSLQQKGNALFYEGINEPFLIRFFKLDEDLGAIYKKIDRDPVIHQAIEKYRGMRIIRQDPWECLLSFICSSAKRVSHIRCMIEDLCKSSGKRMLWNNIISYHFPEPNSIGNQQQLDTVRAGFRTNYLFEANRCIDRSYLLSLKKLPYQVARMNLMKLEGIGKKIADCVLLYSLDFSEAFPIDTWIRKGLQKVYFKGKKVNDQVMEEFVARHFGHYSGYAQLYLYHYWRGESLRQ